MSYNTVTRPSGTDNHQGNETQNRISLFIDVFYFSSLVCLCSELLNLENSNDPENACNEETAVR